MNHLNLLTDQALGESGRDYKDGLGFDVYARVLANAALGTPGPFTIGIFGEWGTGKTSLMQLIKHNLQQEKKVITVWFNAWRYEKEEHPIVPLVGTIVRELERSKPFLAHLKDNGRSLIKSLRAIAYGFSAKSTVKVPGFAEIEASFVAKDMIDREEKLTPDPLLDRSLYYQAFDNLSSVELPANTRVVVIIDDLDRCFPDLAIQLLESIKLVLSQHGFIFIIGVAREVIEGYLKHRYEKEYGLTYFKGDSYLDKIVQLPFYIPPHTGRMEEFSGITLDRLEGQIGTELTEILPIIGEAFKGNPRAIIRFVNNILIDIAINETLVKLGKWKSIPIEFFAITRSLQLRWPDIFTIISNSKNLATNAATWDKEKLKVVISSNEQPDSNLAAKLMTDDKLRGLLLSGHGKKWLQDSENRDATIQFLRTQRHDSSQKAEKNFHKADLYLSFSPSDLEETMRIIEQLNRIQVSSYTNLDIESGSVIENSIKELMSQSRAIAFCIGSNASTSRSIATEIKYALQMHKKEFKPIYPILLPGTVKRDIPAALRNFHYLDLSRGIDVDKLQNLANQIRNPT